MNIMNKLYRFDKNEMEEVLELHDFLIPILQLGSNKYIKSSTYI